MVRGGSKHEIDKGSNGTGLVPGWVCHTPQDAFQGDTLNIHCMQLACFQFPLNCQLGDKGYSQVAGNCALDGFHRVDFL